MENSTYILVPRKNHDCSYFLQGHTSMRINAEFCQPTYFFLKRQFTYYKKFAEVKLMKCNILKLQMCPKVIHHGYVHRYTKNPCSPHSCKTLSYLNLEWHRPELVTQLHRR